MQPALTAMNHEVMTPAPSIRVLLLPGWQNSDALHWQSQWEALYGYERLQQHDWQRPLRGDWSARLQETVVDSAEPVVLVAHSLGCVLTAWWAAHSPLARTRVLGALLVAPADTEAEPVAAQLPGWQPVAQARLPFPSIVVASQDDPYCRWDRSQHFAQAWGAELVDLGPAGHINTASGLGRWDAGHALLRRLIKE